MYCSQAACSNLKDRRESTHLNSTVASYEAVKLRAQSSREHGVYQSEGHRQLIRCCHIPRNQEHLNYALSYTSHLHWILENKRVSTHLKGTAASSDSVIPLDSKSITTPLRISSSCRIWKRCIRPQYHTDQPAQSGPPDS